MMYGPRLYDIHPGFYWISRKIEDRRNSLFHLSSLSFLPPLFVSLNRITFDSVQVADRFAFSRFFLDTPGPGGCRRYNNGSAINRGVLEIRWKEEKKICYTRFVIYSTTSKSTIRGIFRFFPRFENFFASGCISISDPFENLQYYDLGRIRLEKRPRRVSKEKKEKRNETRKLKKLSFENQKCEKKGKKSNQSSTIELYSFDRKGDQFENARKSEQVGPVEEVCNPTIAAK